jgi:hypothetical protein
MWDDILYNTGCFDAMESDDPLREIVRFVPYHHSDENQDENEHDAAKNAGQSPPIAKRFSLALPFVNRS